MAEQAAERFGLRVETNANAALQDALDLAEGRVTYYLAAVAKLTPDQLIEGVERITRRVKADGQPGQGRLVEDVTVAKREPHVLLKLLDAAEKHRVAVAKVMAELGIERRRVTLAEQMGDLMLEALQIAFRRGGLPVDQLPALLAELPGAVEQVEGRAPGEVLPDGELSTTRLPGGRAVQLGLGNSNRGQAD